MADQWWSWILTVVGLTGFVLAGRKVWWCWYVNIGCQGLWYAYAIVTEQWGFLVAVTAYTVVFSQNAYKWTKEHQEKKRLIQKLREPIGKIRVLEEREDGLYAEGHLFNYKKE